MTNQEAQPVNTAGMLCGLQNSTCNNEHFLFQTSAINNRIFIARKNTPTSSFFGISEPFFTFDVSFFPCALTQMDFPLTFGFWALVLL